MIRADSDSIPMDVILEILSRLPANSIARFRFVSKLWKSIICSQDFKKLFLTMPSSSPRLLIVVKQAGESSCLTTSSQPFCCFFSSPQPLDHYGKSSIVVDANFYTKFSEDSNENYFSYASGLVYFPKMVITKKYADEVRVICNPSTGQYTILPPDLKSTYRSHHCGLLGFDPIGKQFKVLVCNGRDDYGRVYHILTLGTENLRWREIKCHSNYVPDSSGICIDGILYYIAYSKIGYFEVRSEEFKYLNVYPHANVSDFQNLINYKGKLCGSKLEYGHDGGFPLKLRMWVLKDVKREEWSAYAYTLSTEDKVVKVNKDLSVVGVTASGEIVLAKKKAHKPFYVFYFNPETNTLLSVEIQGVRRKHEWSRDHRVYYFVDHVEDLNFDVMNTIYAATSIHPPEQSTSTSSREDHQVRTVANLEQDRHKFESVNKFDALCLEEDE